MKDFFGWLGTILPVLVTTTIVFSSEYSDFTVFWVSACGGIMSRIIYDLTK